MYINYLTETNFYGLSANYVFDNNVDFENKKIYTDGRLALNIAPIFTNLKDFKKNNYTLIYLTDQVNFSKLTNFYVPLQNKNITVGKIICKPNNNIKFLKFDSVIDEFEFLAFNYDQSFNSVQIEEPLNVFHFIQKSPVQCNIMYYYKDTEYYLNFNPVTLNLNFTTLSAFNDLKEYTRNFYYTYNEENKVFTLQCRIQGKAYRVVYNFSTNRLALSTLTDISLNDSRCIFYLSGSKNFFSPEITIDWGSYDKKFNQNDLSINSTRSFFDTKTNFLLHAQYIKSEQNYLPCDILTLKTQLNLANISTRGNPFPGEDAVINRNYATIFSGGRQEQGHEKLHLQYQTYTYPYKFLPGKTTWFHTPQSMWPYQRLNINNTTLIDAGAVGGDHPLRSDKVFKKLGNYKSTANFGNSTSEQTGQWLCAWLSAGPDINTKPIWVDRYYNPTKLTPFQALSATPGSISYIPSYECYMTTGIYDVESSLTFEPGNLYAYTHLGKVDALQNINSFSIHQKQKNFTKFYRLDGKVLQPVVVDNITSYEFTGNNYSTVDVSTFNTKLNTFTISFWASRDDWSQPCGFQLAGNFTDYGLGIFQYENVSPLLMFIVTKNNKGSVYAYNENLDLVNIYNVSNTGSNIIDGVCRRDPLNSFHIFTSLSGISELNLQEAIIDSASMPGRVRKVFNNSTHAYFTLNNTVSVGKLDLLTNDVALTSVGLNNYINLRPPAAALQSIFGTQTLDTRIIYANNTLYALSTFNATEPRFRNGIIYYLDNVYGKGGTLFSWDVLSTTKTFSAVLAQDRYYNCFNIDKTNNIWCASGGEIHKYGQYGLLQQITSLAPLLSSTIQGLKIFNISFADNFIDGALKQNLFVSCSGNTAKTLYVVKLDSDGTFEKIININTDSYTEIDCSNDNFYYSKINLDDKNNYSFKVRLYNQFNTEDSIILNLPIDHSDLNAGYHHFSITLDTLNGAAKLYVDGEEYTSTTFSSGKYAFTPLLLDNLTVGATPFYNGATFNSFLNINGSSLYYTVKDLKVENFYWFNTILNYFDISMLYKEKIEPNSLVWDIPCGRRHYNETIARYFKNRIPGAKSSYFNVSVNTSTLDAACRDALEPKIIETIGGVIPAYAKLNKFMWVTNLPSLSATDIQPYYPGNTLTNSGLTR